MVLRCPRCSTLKFFGRTQVLGELVVCPKCGAVFAWRDAEGANGAKSKETKSTQQKRRLGRER
jgi:uncharacterized C2H2 Zn-finger protein